MESVSLLFPGSRGCQISGAHGPIPFSKAAMGQQIDDSFLHPNDSRICHPRIYFYDIGFIFS